MPGHPRAVDKYVYRLGCGDCAPTVLLIGDVDLNCLATACDVETVNLNSSVPEPVDDGGPDPACTAGYDC
jgi:hypothetical protein